MENRYWTVMRLAVKQTVSLNKQNFHDQNLPTQIA
jgi:hypothetical protein